ncbi:MAG: GNAT family N-acetyltransferase [Spirochaetes bacterium GWF1_51_8]|nr:MAG: GNAT family N-acetyltransferase [Spirochaetes bacterium GWF1_51_8]
MPYFKRLVGKKCYLSPMNPEDAPKYVGWFSDLEVAVNLKTQMNINLLSEREFLEKNLKDGNPIFAIIDLATDKLIGNCGLHDIGWVGRHAEFGILIGEKEYWNKGYGEEATRLILDFGFNIINLHNIFLKVMEFNKRAVRAYEKAGFKQIGRWRKAFQIAGKRYDFILMDILADEYESGYVKNFIKE